jgi:hypothetical protein
VNRQGGCSRAASPFILEEGHLKRLLSHTVGAAALLAVSSAASAATLVDVTNLPVQFVTPQSFTFIATSTSTKVDFQGYQLPGTLALVNIFLGETGDAASVANNLLGTHFNYTAATCGAYAGEGSLGSYGTNDLTFAGGCAGFYDSLAQTVSTSVGASYTLTFVFSNVGQGPNGLRIFATDAAATGAVPEPATWAMMLLGFAGIGFQLRSSRNSRALASMA